MKKGRTISWLVVGLVIGLIIGGVGGYIITNNFHRAGFQGRGNFQINEETKNKISSFFENKSDMNEIKSYCDQNRMYCVYYCTNINQNHEICTELGNYTRMTGGRQWSQ